MYKLYPPLKCEVKKTRDKGWGVFATNPIYKDELIEECHLLSIPSEALESYPSLYLDYRFNLPVGTDHVTDLVLPLGFGCIYNHSDNNNAYWREHPTLDRIFQFIATKDIQAGDEICTYYGGGQYWDKRTHIKIV